RRWRDSTKKVSGELGAVHHGGNQITWRDNPGILNVDVIGGQRRKIGADLRTPNPATYRGDFVAFVGGTQTCWCRFTVDIQYDPNNPQVTGSGLRIVDSNRCRRIGAD
ncbi:MAG: hypothetical protein MPN21_14715, partial [Thermoanaerobaculia bacterium]|nr:hypothetical protein [Thermoanaerobaculia bacterium]